MQPSLILFVSPLFLRLTVQYRLHHWKYIWFVSRFFVDLKAMEAAVRSIACDGLEWKASKYIIIYQYQPTLSDQAVNSLQNTD